jgi:IPT/TIG domain
MASALKFRSLVSRLSLVLLCAVIGLFLGGVFHYRLRAGVHAAVPSPTPALAALPQSWGGGGPPPPTAHQRYAAFLSGGGFYSELLLQNLQADRAVTVSSTIVLSSGQIPLGSVTLPPHSAQTLDISSALWNDGYSTTRGTVMVQYSTVSYSQVTALARSYNEASHVYLNSFAQSPEEYWLGTSYDAVLWAPDEGTKGLVFLTNSSSEPRQVRVTLLTAGGGGRLAPVDIPPGQTQWLSVDDLVSESRLAGAGVHVSFSGNPGDIVAGGLLYNERTGFAKYIHFADESLPYPTAALRTNLVLLGFQPLAEGYPAGISFRSVAAIHNTETQPVSVVPRLTYLEGGTTQRVTLPSLTLPPDGSAIVDLTKEQADSIIPAGVSEAALELQPSAPSGSIVAELFSFDGSTGGYVVGPSFTSYPAHGTASAWRIDGGFTTTAIVGSAATQDDKLVLKLYSAAGLYSKTFAVPAGGLVSINVKQLQQDATPDDNGKTLTGTSGIMYLSGSRNNLSKLTFDVIVHSTSEADYVGYQNNPCDMVDSIDLYIDCVTGESPCAVMQAWYWSISGVGDQPGTQTASSNTSLAQISQNSSGDDQVTFTPSGQSSSVTLYFTPGSINTTDCEACSYGPVPVQSVSVTVPEITSISPSKGPVSGTVAVTIDGSGFGASGATVSAGLGIAVTVNSASNTQIQASFQIGSGAAGGDRLVTVTASGITSNSADFYVQIPASLAIVGGTDSTTSETTCSAGSYGTGCGVTRSFIYQVEDQEFPPEPIDYAGLEVWDSFGTPSPNSLNLTSFVTTCSPANTGPCNVTTNSLGEFGENSPGLSACSTVCYVNNSCTTGGPTTVAQTWHVGPSSIVQTISYYCQKILVNGQ